jgi:hypothetical protein
MLRYLDCSQTSLIEKLNRYLCKTGRNTLPDDGACFGLALVWLQKMAEGKVEWFYNTIDTIIQLPDHRFDEIEILVEKFFALVEWAQNSRKYVEGLTQEDIAKILDIRWVETSLFAGSSQEMHKRLRERRHPIMHVMTANEHAIAVFQQGMYYYVYDSNNPSGRASVFLNKELAVAQVKYCLYDSFDIKAPETLGIQIYSIRPNHDAFVAPQDPTLMDIEAFNEPDSDSAPLTPTTFSSCTIL